MFRLALILTLTIFSTAVFAQTPKKKELKLDRLFIASSAVFWAGVAANTMTQDHHKVWAGPVRCTFAPDPHIGQTIAINSAIYGVSILIDRKWPKVGNIIRFGGGAANAGMVAYNNRPIFVPPHRYCF